MNETWREIPGFDGMYEASSDGRLRSYWVRGHTIRSVTPRALNFRRGTGPYVQARLRRPDGSYKSYKLHQVVAAAFLGPCPPGYQIAHGNGRGHDNRPANLSYATPRVNQNHKRKHGTLLAGMAHPGRKIDEAAVAEIRRRCAAREHQSIVGASFGITQQQVSKIVTGKRWPPTNQQGDSA